ncbi:hypothetical protein [Herbiconiux daphne]|uniref:Gram-positive cocci surface proteins LPxTG domain-containing protein n=1 Tax=Herbiconiux daphne TaxID=2970914 RepID=A0ABT2H0X0_9MICO|nr:hypothetical protein [Herbiconiux daphne]MCS5733576.1 hypothetical protein [Herbiconiux daphne]
MTARPTIALFGAAVPVLLASALLGATGPAAAAAAAAPSASVAVPVSFAVESGASGRFYPTVDILLGSDPDPYTVILDTGSTALVMTVPVAGATVTDAPASVTYDGFSVDGTIATTDLTIGGATATGVNLLAGTCSGCDFGGATGIDGIMGVGQALQTQTSPSTGTAYPWFSPLMQLDDTALAQGFTIDLGAGPGASGGTGAGSGTGTGAGTLTLGAPTITTGETGVTSIAAAKTSQTYPTALAYPVFDKPFPLCWQVEHVTPLCQVTTVDTGAPTGLLTGAQFDGLLPGLPADPSTLPAQTDLGALPTGTALKFSAPGSTTSFASWLADDTTQEMHLYNSITDGHLNTGNAFFLDRTVAFHYETGRMLVQAGTTGPGAPATVTTTASDSSVKALWADAADGGGTAGTAASGAAGSALESQSATAAASVTDRLVRVRDAATGAVVQRFNLPGSATSTVITGLTNDRAYVVDIASASRHGISDYTSAEAVTPRAGGTGAAPGPATTSATDAAGAPRLAATGSSPEGLLAIVASLLAAGLLLLFTRRSRRSS